MAMVWRMPCADHLDLSWWRLSWGGVPYLWKIMLPCSDRIRSSGCLSGNTHCQRVLSLLRSLSAARGSKVPHNDHTWFLLLRVACVIPPVVAMPPSLWVARPPSLYSSRLRALRQCLREHTRPYHRQLQQLTTLRSLQFPELRLVQFDSGMTDPVGTGYEVWYTSSGIQVSCSSFLFLFFREVRSFSNPATETEIWRTTSVDFISDGSYAGHFRDVLELPLSHLCTDWWKCQQWTTAGKK